MHAQSHLGGVKGSEHYLNFGGKKDYWVGAVGNKGINWGVLELLACTMFCACPFNLMPGVFMYTLSQMCGKLNLPILLFNVGLLTLIKWIP